MNPTIHHIQLANNNYAELRKFIMNKDYMSFVKSNTSFLPDSAIIKQRLWHIINDVLEIKTCKCNIPLKWNIKDNKYRSFCSSKCAHTDNSVREKTEKTCIERFGVKTNLLSADAKINYSNKMIEKFGVDNPFKSKIVQQQIKNNIFNEYGVTNISKLDSIKEKINQTHLKKYNRLRQCQTHFSDESYDVKYDKKKLIDLYDTDISIKDIAIQLNVGYSQLCIQFKNFGIDVHRFVGQYQIFEFIKSIYDGEILFNDRKLLDGKEIDILLPDLNIGFEHDGLFWHCQDSSGKITYHKEKDDLAKVKGIKLFHILDLEWKNNQELVKSRISSLLGVNKIIYGRNTTIRTLNKKEETIFFNQNHIQGSVGSSLCIGLEHECKLVAAMSFGKSRYNSYQYELLRFCSIQNYNIVGGASKLFKFATKQLNAETILSFCDLRWGTGKLYSTLGFNHVRDNGPSYSYTQSYKTFESRIKYQKHKLKNILPIFDQTLSEWENMKANGYDRYWNSGNAVYLWSKTT